MIRIGLVALLLLAGCAAPGTRQTAPSPVTAPKTVLSPIAAIEALPAELNGFRRTIPIVDFETSPNGAGLGASARYVPINGERIVSTVFIYDRGQHRQPDGGESPDVGLEIAAAHSEMNGMVRIGRFRTVTPGSAADFKSADKTTQRCASFSVVQQDGSPTGDAICVTINKGRFVKVRLTAWNVPDVGAGVMAGALLLAVVDAQAGR